jgi:uncharacterized protein
MATAKRKTLSASVKNKLKHYVYLLVDPSTNIPFYVGKGQNNRVQSHIRANGNLPKDRKIRELCKTGRAPILEILRYGLNNDQAMEVEAATIDVLGKDKLYNRVRGHGTSRGRRQLEAIVNALNEVPAEFRKSDKLLLVNVAKNFRQELSDQELYDFTRSAWRVSQRRREEVKYALAVYQRVIHAVYEIKAWFQQGSTLKGYRVIRGCRTNRKRWEFIGQLASKTLQKRFVGRRVPEKYFPPGAQNPIAYVNCA